MALEWIRRRDATFDRYLRKFLFGSEEDSIVAAEYPESPSSEDPTLRIGSLREEEARPS